MEGFSPMAVKSFAFRVKIWKKDMAQHWGGSLSNINVGDPMDIKYNSIAEQWTKWLRWIKENGVNSPVWPCGGPPPCENLSSPLNFRYFGWDFFCPLNYQEFIILNSEDKMEKKKEWNFMGGKVKLFPLVMIYCDRISSFNYFATSFVCR